MSVTEAHAATQSQHVYIEFPMIDSSQDTHHQDWHHSGHTVGTRAFPCGHFEHGFLKKGCLNPMRQSHTEPSESPSYEQ
jgi:hypothetical protein